jgi:hypothetical protein
LACSCVTWEGKGDAGFFLPGGDRVLFTSTRALHVSEIGHSHRATVAVKQREPGLPKLTGATAQKSVVESAAFSPTPRPDTSFAGGKTIVYSRAHAAPPRQFKKRQVRQGLRSQGNGSSFATGHRTSAQFKKKKEPAKYRYDRSLDPQLSWDIADEQFGKWKFRMVRNPAKTRR